MTETIETEKYKQTEVGLIPSDWEVTKLFEVIEANRSIRYGIVQPGKFEPNGCLMLRSQDYSKGWSNSDEMHRVNPALENQYKNARLNKNDLIMTVVGAGIGQVVIAPDWLDKAIVSRSTARIAIDKAKAAREYILCCLTSPLGVRQILDAQKEGAQPVISCLDLAKFNIPYPSLEEQTAIAKALSDADALISSLETLIAKKRNIKQGAMQKLLEPKAGWLHKSLGEVGIITGAGVDKTINEDEVPVRLVNYMDVFRRDFIYSNHLSHWVTTPAYKAQKCAVQKGDIFFTPSSEMRYDIAISAVAMEDMPDAAYSYHLVRLRLFEEWDLNFRTYIFKTKYFLDQAEQVCEGSGKRYVISLPKFRGLKIFIPPTREEQNRIATILSDMDAEITSLETKLEKYKKVKLGMMQELLTGRIRLV